MWGIDPLLHACVRACVTMGISIQMCTFAGVHACMCVRVCVRACVQGSLSASLSDPLRQGPAAVKSKMARFGTFASLSGAADPAPGAMDAPSSPGGLGSSGDHDKPMHRCEAGHNRTLTLARPSYWFRHV